MSSHADDRTAKAVIRDEAMRLFAVRGADAVTIRDIAAAASVSPALVIQHYGSKDGLRGAVDTHVVALFEGMIAQVTRADLAHPEDNSSLYQVAATFFPPGSPMPGYLGRLLVSDSEAGTTLFRGLFQVARVGLDRMIATGTASGGADADARAAFLLANDLAVIILHARLADVLGADPLAADGMARWAPEVLAVYSGGLNSPVDPGEPEPK